MVRGPTPVVTGRGRAVPLRTTRAWPPSSRASRQRVTYAAASSCSAAAIIRRAPSRAKSSSVVLIVGASPASSSDLVVITFNMGGVPFPRLPPGPWGFDCSTSPEGYVAFLSHPQLLTIAPRFVANATILHYSPNLTSQESLIDSARIPQSKVP